MAATGSAGAGADPASVGPGPATGGTPARSDRHRPAGRPPRHGGEFIFADPATWGTPHASTTTETRLYGTATAKAWDRLHPRLTRRAAWPGSGDLPNFAGTVIHLQVNRLSSGATPKAVRLWWSGVRPTQTSDPADADPLRQTFLRRFDVEHTFRMLKQTLDWTSPNTRSPDTADRWTWLIARPLVADLRRPWKNQAHPTDCQPPASGATLGTCGPDHLPRRGTKPTGQVPDEPVPSPPTGTASIVTATTSTRTSTRKKPAANP